MSEILSLEKILNLIKTKKRGFINLSASPLDNYKGMYKEYAIIYNYDKNNYRLMHSLVCYVLDGFGDDSQDIEYEFSSVEEIIKYVEKKLNKKLKDMVMLDRMKIPTIFDITDEEKKEFEKIWLECIKDFDEGKFLDKNLKFIQ